MESGAVLARRDGLALPSEGTNGGVWLIFADRDGLGSRLAEWLKERGDQVVTVGRSGITRTDDQGRWQLVEEPLQALCLAPLRGAGVPIRGVVHLWSLDAPEASRMREPDLEEQTLLGCGVLHWWLRQSTEETRPTPLWLVTRGAAAAGKQNTVLQLLPALVLGMGEALAVEQPGLAVCTVDLAAVPLADEAGALGREILFPTVRIALRCGRKAATQLDWRRNPPGSTRRFGSSPTRLIASPGGGVDWDCSPPIG